MSHYLTSIDIAKVEMNNVQGKFTLNEEQLEKFKTDFLKTKTVPKLSVKTGSLAMIITLTNGESYVARGSFKSEFIEVSTSIATRNKEELADDKWLVLDTRETNFNNYRPR